MAQYILEGGLRRVQPYFFTHRTHCKGRWFARTVIDVFSSEFRDRPVDYYINQIENGNFKIFTRSGNTLSHKDLTEYKISNGDIVEYTQHQHEPVVPDLMPQIVFEDEELLVVNKPSGIPVHPTQKYYHNSVTGILENEFGYDQLIPCHRLDKLTSGVLILAKNNTKARAVQLQIQNKQRVEKLYIARVVGEFPTKEVVCNDPVVNVQTKKTFVNGNPESKPATTIFNRVSYNSTLNQSIVKCQPLTGRTHQIRIHLRNLGFPIVNDPLYADGGLLHAVRDNIQEHQFNELIGTADKNRESLVSLKRCEVCHSELYNDYDPDKLVVWLHSLRYKIGDHCFQTELPQWSKIS